MFLRRNLYTGKRALRLVWLIVLLLSTFALLPAQMTQAEDVTLTDCTTASLTAAVNTANSNSEADYIGLMAGCTYTLSATLTIEADGGNELTIDGNGATISGNNAVRVLTVNSGAVVLLNYVTISGGNAGSGNGGGIHNSGFVSLEMSAVTGSSAYDGGGIYTTGPGDVVMYSSRISGNSAANAGGGISGNGATLVSSIISGNSASEGGGIYTTNVLSLNMSTVTGNTATGVGGVYNGGMVSVINSIIANNSGSNCVSSSATVQYSLIEDGSCGVVNGVNGNLSGVDPAFNADFTLSASSPAINAGDASFIYPSILNLGDCNEDLRVRHGELDMGACESNFAAPLPTLSINDVSLAEGHSGATTYIFILSMTAAAPAGGVTFTYQTADGTATAGSDYYAISPTNGSIPEGGWGTSVTVTVPGDYVAEGNETFFVNITNVVGALVTDAQGTGTINNDDTAGIVISPTSGLTTTEAGGTATFNIRLNSQPTGDVTIGLSSNDPTEGSVPASVTIPIASWQSGVDVTVTGVDDFVDDGNVPYTIVTGAATGGDYAGLNPAEVSVTNTDNDTAGINVAPTSGLTTTETGGTAIFNIRLTSQPSADVTIGLTSNDTGEGTVPVSVTIPVANWQTGVDVTVTGVDDFVDDGNVPYTIITGAATGGDYAGLNPADVSVTNTDDDTVGIIVNPSVGLTTTEAGGTAVFNLALTSQPTADVTIGLTSNDPTEGSVAASVTILVANWQTGVDVTVTGVDDLEADGNVAYTIVTAAASGGDYAGIDPNDASLTNADNDTANIIVSPTASLTTTEAGGTATFNVALTSQPTGDVSFGLTSSDLTEGSVPASVTIPAANWQTGVDVTMTGVDDLEDDGDIPYTIITAAATGGGYDGIDPVDVSVTNTDDDSAGIIVAPTSGLTTTEAGGTATFNVRLNSQPTGDVTINLTNSDTGEGSVPVFVTIPAANWQTGADVTITGVDDLADDGDIPYTIITGSSASFDGNYTAIDPADVSVVNIDNDTAATSTPSPTATPDVTVTPTFTPTGTSEPGGNEPTATPDPANAYPPPPDVPECDAHNADAGGVVRSNLNNPAVNCRVMYQNGHPTTWFGADLYHSGHVGIQGMLDLGVQQAIDIFSPSGQTYFNGGAVFCLRGTGTLIWMAASHAPRTAEIIGSYTVPEFPGFTCATLFEPGTLVLVSRNPMG